MAKKKTEIDYSGSIVDSLNGREKTIDPLSSDDVAPTDSKTETTTIDVTEKPVETENNSVDEPVNVDPVDSEKPKTKKSNAGRKKMDVRKKKKQMVLTLSPDAYNRLIEWADTKPRSAPNYVSEFVEEHLDDIMK